MDKSVSIKPQQSLNLSLENVAHLKNPQLSIRILDSDEQPHLRSSVSSTSIHSLDYDHKNSKQCTSCDSLKRMLYLRDRTIMKLAEENSLLKIKLTKNMNMNIELSRQLMKYQKMPSTSTLMNPPSPLRSKSPVNTQIREEVADLRRKCTELDEIYHHLKHHLFALRNVFADLGANTTTVTNDSGSGYHMDDEDCSSINSSLSRGSTPKNGKLYTNKNKVYIVEDDDDGNESGDTDFRPLPPTRSSLAKNRFNKSTKVDDNNNRGSLAAAVAPNQQPDQSPRGKADEPSKKQQLDSRSNGEVMQMQEEPQLSNFDIWYNS